MKRLYNTTKDRFATPNEIAKFEILDALNVRSEFLFEHLNVRIETEKKQNEISEQFYKQRQYIINRLSTNDIFKYKA